MALYIGEKRVSELECKDYTLDSYSFSDLYLSTLEFMEENFRGAAIVTGRIEEPGYLTVSVYGLAHFIKRLLSIVFGDCVLKIHAKGTKFSFSLELSFERSTQLSKEEKDELEKIAELSGFKATLNEFDGGGSYLLVFNILHSSEAPIYAKNTRNIRAALEKSFFYIPFE